jgi:hypothetical protein
VSQFKHKLSLLDSLHKNATSKACASAIEFQDDNIEMGRQIRMKGVNIELIVDQL